jgi:hypothetical protein
LEVDLLPIEILRVCCFASHRCAKFKADLRCLSASLLLND